MKIGKILLLLVSVTQMTLLVALGGRQQMTPEQKAQEKLEQYLQSAEERALLDMRKYEVTQEETAILNLEVQAALDEWKDPQTIAKIVKDAEDAAQDDMDQARRKVEDKIKWENTLLTPLNWRFGWYNRDFVEVGFIGAGILADTLLYRELLKRRVEVVIEVMKEDYDRFIKILKLVDIREEKYEDQYAEQSALGKLFTNDKKSRELLIKPLKDYIAEKHKFVGFTGLSKTTVVPLLLRWGYDKLSNFIEHQIISYDAYNLPTIVPKLMHEQGRRPTEWKAFQRSPGGHLVQAPRTPLSYVNIARLIQWFYNPFYVTTKLGLPTVVDQLETFNTFADLKIPKVAFSKGVKLFLEILGMGFSAKIFDAENSNTWTTYCTSHRQDLLEVLEDYKKARENPQGDKAAVVLAAQKIKKFVEKGHERKGWLPGLDLRTWLTSKYSGETRIPNAISLGMLAVIGYKGYNLYTKFMN